VAEKRAEGPPETGGDSGQSPDLQSFFQDGFFDWQRAPSSFAFYWDAMRFDEVKYGGGFARSTDLTDHEQQPLPDWAIGPFVKYPGNPVFAPSTDGWDRGYASGGVHNGSIVQVNGLFHYIYRGEQELETEENSGNENQPGPVTCDYICDIGLATSPDGIHFTRDLQHSPFFRTGDDARYSFEDVNLVKHEETWYLFCNRWNWAHPVDPSDCGIFLATSKDLRHWQKHGLVFPHADQIHRNACVLQNPANEAVKVNGRFVMYINNGLIAFSDDMLNWQSEKVDTTWPGGEGCFALTDYSRKDPNRILLFTGGHHSGHFYAIGEVLLSKNNPRQPLAWLPHPVLTADEQIPYENGLSAAEPHDPVSRWRHTVFFTGMTLHKGKWMVYYGGSEYYTCLATAAGSSGP